MRNLQKTNPNIDLLIKFELSDENSFQLFNNSTRDSLDSKVLKCMRSGVIVLEKSITSDKYYQENTFHSDEYLALTENASGLIEFNPPKDDLRRFERNKKLINGSEILDFGCGKGGFIKLSEKISKRSVGVEINNFNKEFLKDLNVEFVDKLSDLNNDKFDLITLNHVFEHLNNPIDILIELQKYLKDEGILIIEVPHARDLLMETFDLQAFKNFTLWREHLILHTRKSLETFATNSGFQLKKIEGIQRYSISNHYNWLLNGQPNGHKIFSKLNKDYFHKHYAKFLESINQTDTLVGYFKKNI